MKKIFAMISLMLLLLLCAFFAGFAADTEGQGSAESTEGESTAQESAEPENAIGTALCKGIIASATDIDGDGFLDIGGKVEIKLLVESPVGYITLDFGAAEFADMAVSAGEGKKVSVAAGDYAVNAALSMEYYGELSLLKKDEFSTDDVEKIENCFIAAWRRNGGKATVLPDGNEVYSTYLSLWENRKAELPEGVKEAGFAFEYNEESGNAKIIYKGVVYTAAEKLGDTVKQNPIVVTANGKPLNPNEIGAHVRSLAEGEMLALFGDIAENDGDGRVFELLDLKKTSDFAPVSAEFSPVSGAMGENFSYVLFDSEARISVPEGRVFSSRPVEGAGLSLVLAASRGSAGYYANVKAYINSNFDAFEAVRGEKIAAAEQAGEYIKVTLESGKAALLPTAEMLESKELEAEFFYELGGAVCSQTACINTAESSWFASLASFYEVNGNGACALVGAELTAVLGADGVAVYVEINE